MKRYFNKITLILSLCLAVVCVSPGLASEENVQAALYQQGMEVYDRIALSFKTMLNSPGGADCAAAANLLSARTLFVEENFTGRELWVFTYKDAFPVVVSFISEEEDFNDYVELLTDAGFVYDARQTASAYTAADRDDHQVKVHHWKNGTITVEASCSK